jgi:hypothetical protein
MVGGGRVCGGVCGKGVVRGVPGMGLWGIVWGKSERRLNKVLIRMLTLLFWIIVIREILNPSKMISHCSEKLRE